MLSPKARNFVNLTRGMAVTFTWNTHCERCEVVSVAVHTTSDVPNGNAEPVARVQVVDTGVTPPVTVGAGYCTNANDVSLSTLMSAGHVMTGAGTTGGVGGMGPPESSFEQPAYPTSVSSTARIRRVGRSG